MEPNEHPPQPVKHRPCTVSQTFNFAIGALSILAVVLIFLALK